MERIAIMDAAPLDAACLAEHHFNGYSVCPSVYMMGMHVAGFTKRLSRLAPPITARVDATRVCSAGELAG